ncbi:PREDICTED: interferon-induced protein 44 [Ceratotherium simum simum]|uniref:Interferon-induced protein 44 n=1 Tax=Ceratotherium simum simum TaxID=73337 RepID=A0ABM0HQ36_CERSS|nr:PREDICTED: interferon-induced protein 44 [Ceratotherium simum simum]
MTVTTRLTWVQEKSLQNHFGGKQFSLLYKASDHEFSPQVLLQICSDQGPTVTVIYSGDHVIGAFMQKSYQAENEVSIKLFAFQETEILECEIRPCTPSMLFPVGKAKPWQRNSEFNIDLQEKYMYIHSNTSKKLGLPQCDSISFKECEVFRCEDVLDKRTMEGVTELRESLLSCIRTYKPYGDLVPQIRILLLGPIGAGKSSFSNSVKSVFQGRVMHQALVGSDTTGISEKYRTYSVKDKQDGNSLPFILCDSMGLGEEEEGLCMDDIPYILKGHISDRYQFNPMKPITSGHCNYIDSPLLKDRIHCVAFVFDANSIEHLSHEMVSTIRRVRRKLIKYGMVHLVLLTHVDSMDLITKDDFIDIYRCLPVKSKVEAVHKELGFALSDILVVSNYTCEWELDPLKDVLILSALRHMLWAADDFLEDLPLEDTR